MVKDAEAHAEEDAKKKELIEARNQADTLIYTTEKSLRDLGDKVESDLRSDIESKIETLKQAKDGDDLEAIKKATDDLSQASHKLAEKLYAQQQEGGAQAGGEQAQQGQQGQGQSQGGEDEDVVDAEYTEMK